MDGKHMRTKNQMVKHFCPPELFLSLLLLLLLFTLEGGYEGEDDRLMGFKLDGGGREGLGGLGVR